MTTPRARRDADPYRFWGLQLTWWYVLFLVLYSAAMWDVLVRMTPHDFADCLAGAFGPVALLWVILGYFQQSAGLRNSVDALRHQIEASDRQYDVAVQAAADANKAAEPKLRLRWKGGELNDNLKRYTYELRNVGPECTDLVISLNGNVHSRFSRFSTDDMTDFSFMYNRGDPVGEVEVVLTYVTSNGKDGQTSFHIGQGKQLATGEDSLGQPQRVD